MSYLLLASLSLLFSCALKDQGVVCFLEQFLVVKLSDLGDLWVMCFSVASVGNTPNATAMTTFF